MSGGSKDDATLAIAYRDEETGKAVLASVMAQNGKVPFNPRDAVQKFAAEIKAYGLSRVVGDNYAGETFRRDFESAGVTYVSDSRSASDLYEAFEPALNAGEVELLDVPKLTDQMISLIWKGNKITHQSNDHDDYCTAAAGALLAAAEKKKGFVVTDEMLERFSKLGSNGRHFGSTPFPTTRSLPMSTTHKPPRMNDAFGFDAKKPPARPDTKAAVTEDSRPVVMGEPMALDLSTVRRSRRHKAGIAADARPLAYGEPIPLDRSAITYHPRPASGSLAEDGKPGLLVQGETYPIAD